MKSMTTPSVSKASVSIDATSHKRRYARSSVTKLHSAVTSNVLVSWDLDMKATKLQLVNSLIEELKNYDSIILEGELLPSRKDNIDELVDIELETCSAYLERLTLVKVILERELAYIGDLGRDHESTNTSQNVSSPNRRSRIQLPKLPLPEFHADKNLDRLNCTNFFTEFENLTSPYSLNETEKFNLLLEHTKGRANRMITTMPMANKNYGNAKDILLKSFCGKTSQRFSVIEKLFSLKLDYRDDPYLYFSDLQQLYDLNGQLEMSMDHIFQYAVWNGLNTKMKNILIQLTQLNEDGYPPFSEIYEKFLVASNRVSDDSSRFERLNPVNLNFKNRELYPKSQTNAKFDRYPQKTKAITMATNLRTSRAPNMWIRLNKCYLCTLDNPKSDINHSLMKCSIYSSAAKRITRAIKYKLCTQCLLKGHIAKDCRYVPRENCGSCHESHLTMMCPNERPLNSFNAGSSRGKINRPALIDNSNEAVNSIAILSQCQTYSGDFVIDAIMPTFSINVKTDCSELNIKCMLDSGSQNSLLLTSIANRLNLKIYENNISLKLNGFNSGRSFITKSVLLPLNINNVTYTLKCVCIPDINITCKYQGLDKLTNRLSRLGYSVADTDINSGRCNILSDIHMLLGGNDWQIVMEMPIQRFGPQFDSVGAYLIENKLILTGSLSCWHNALNWHEEKSIIDYKVQSPIEVSKLLCFKSSLSRSENVSDFATTEIDKGGNLAITSANNVDELENICKKFLNLDEKLLSDGELTESELKVTDFILEHSYRNKNGAFVMAIPWISRFKDKLGYNRNLAYKVLMSVKRKYENSVILSEVNELFREQERDGIISKIMDPNEYELSYPRCSFISHFPLIKKDRLTTKLRIIYMANLTEKSKNKESRGLSINNCVHPGFSKNLKLFHLLVFMRFDLYLMTFDISKAYLRLLISDQNRSKFLFLWFRDLSRGDFTPITYQFCRVMFGLSVSPYLLLCSMYMMLIMGNEDDSMEVCKLKALIYQSCYVDNFFLGANTITELKKYHSIAVDAFSDCKFPLQQFTTNNMVFQTELDLTQEKTEIDVKMLGMTWNRVTDTIKCKKCQLDIKANTKRKILAELNSIYDLTGACIPVLNRAKIFLRSLQCDLKLKWDEVLSKDRVAAWTKIVRQFNSFKPVEIPRFIGKKDSCYTLIIMCDASKVFMGTVIYIKDNSCNKISFLYGKNRLFGKEMYETTIPVKETCALEYGLSICVELYSALVRAIIPIKIAEVICFSDSMITLAWLRSAEIMLTKPKCQSILLRNRIKSIVSHCQRMGKVKFAHIGSHDNPSDLMTRETSPRALEKSKLIDPPILLREHLDEFDYICLPNSLSDNDSSQEFSVNIAEISKENCLDNIFDCGKYATLGKAIRVLKCLRQCVNLWLLKVFRNRQSHLDSVGQKDITYKDCYLQLIKQSQLKYFSDIFEFFNKKSASNLTSPMLITRLNIMLDPKDGLLKVKTKMHKLCVKEVNSQLILLHNESKITRALIMMYHENSNHSGLYYIINQIRSSYWILKNFSTIKKVVKSCYLCRRFNSHVVKVNTNDYRSWALTTNRRLFDKTYIDMFGPYYTKYGNVKTKTWCLLFKCTWSRCINIQVMVGAAAKDVMNALQNHIYEYGLMNYIISDAGSNFKATISSLVDIMESYDVKEYLDRFNIKFTYAGYPKGSLNRGIGGYIENGVGMVKKQIYGAIKNNVLDFIEFCGVIKQCICFANKRPLINNALLRNNDVHESYQVISPEVLKYGYELSVLDIYPASSDSDWKPGNDLKITPTEVEKIIKIKDDIRNNYYSDFLFSLIDLAAHTKEKYKRVKHTKLKIGDVVLIRDDFVKTVNYPMGIITDIELNSNNEVIRATIYKANGRYITRDVSSLTLLVPHDQNRDTSDVPTVFNDCDESNKLTKIDSNINDVNCIPQIKVRRAAAVSGEVKRKQMSELGLI